MALPPKSKAPTHRRAIGMSRTQGTILLGGVPTRPLQETVPRSKSAAVKPGPEARKGGTKTQLAFRCDDAGVWWRAARRAEHFVWGAGPYFVKFDETIIFIS